MSAEMSMEDATRILEAAQANQLAMYEPYKKQRKFHDLGAGHRERCLIAANKTGKCITSSTQIEHPDGSTSTVGELHKLNKPFPVLAWDEERHCRVETMALPVFKKDKPSECYRVTMSDGSWFECADDHRLLATSGTWHFFSSLLERSSCESRSPTARVGGASRWTQRVRDSLSGYLHDLRSDGGQLPSLSEIFQSLLPSPAYAQAHNGPSRLLDDLGRIGTSIRRYWIASSLPSTESAALHSAGRSFASSGRAYSNDAESCFGSPQSALRTHPGSASHPQSDDAVPSRQYRQSWAFDDLLSYDENKIVAIDHIGVNDVYDFTVPHYHNYCLAGLVHHNTHCGGAEMAIHLTGLYPDDWKGRRFDKPIIAWATGQTNESTRDVVQTVLMGQTEPFGTGMIPKDCIGTITRARGMAGYIDTVEVKHATGGKSMLRFKSYQQGVEKWMGPNIHVIWMDEEPDISIYNEALMRTAKVKGLVYITFTPLLGVTSTVDLFWPEATTSERATVNMKLEDADHFRNDPVQLQKVLDSLTDYEKDARSKGIPMLGEGRVFNIPEDAFLVEPFEIPAHFKQIIGLDLGWTHPTAAAWLAFDADADTAYLVDEYRMAKQTHVVHASALKRRGQWIPVAWPHDGYQSDRQSGVPISEAYRREGVRMLPVHATYPQGHWGVEAGAQDILARLETGRFKVFNTCSKWLEEYRIFHRKDGKIVKVKDDLIAATRYALMMLRFARGNSVTSRLPSRIGMDYDPLGYHTRMN